MQYKELHGKKHLTRVTVQVSDAVETLTIKNAETSTCRHDTATGQVNVTSRRCPPNTLPSTLTFLNSNIPTV